jgi:hypothetical protein
MVPITLHGPLDSIDLVALVGAGEHEAPGSLVQCDCQLGRRRWPAPFIFVDVPIRPVLGQIGFFAFFNVTFRYAKREMDIRWTG